MCANTGFIVASAFCFCFLVLWADAVSGAVPRHGKWQWDNGFTDLLWEGRLEEGCATVDINPIMVDCHIFTRPSRSWGSLGGSWGDLGGIWGVLEGSCMDHGRSCLVDFGGILGDLGGV